MLLTDSSRRDFTARRGLDCCAENRFRHENAFRVVTEGTVTEVGDDLLRLVEPVMDALIILNAASPFVHAGERMMIRMCHDRLRQNV